MARICLLSLRITTLDTYLGFNISLHEGYSRALNLLKMFHLKLDTFEAPTCTVPLAVTS